jgi:hypothetical protein
MFTDPIQVSISTPPDKFWGLTSTAWAAISSLVSAATTFGLLIFNWRYLRFVHQQSDAAKKQVELTSESLALTTRNLEALKKQMVDQEERERHTAIAILGETVDKLVLWGNRSRMEHRTPDSRIEILPENWGIVISFLSRRAPELALKAYQASRELREAEVDLNRYVQTDTGSRGNNSSLGQLYDNMHSKIQHGFETVNALLTEVHNLQ